MTSKREKGIHPDTYPQDRGVSELKYHIGLTLLHFSNIFVIMVFASSESSVLPIELYEALKPHVISMWFYFIDVLPFVAMLTFFISVYRIWKASRWKKIPYILWCMLSFFELFKYCCYFAG